MPYGSEPYAGGTYGGESSGIDPVTDVDASSTVSTDVAGDLLVTRYLSSSSTVAVAVSATALATINNMASDAYAATSIVIGAHADLDFAVRSFPPPPPTVVPPEPDPPSAGFPETNQRGAWTYLYRHSEVMPDPILNDFGRPIGNA